MLGYLHLFLVLTTLGPGMLKNLTKIGLSSCMENLTIEIGLAWSRLLGLFHNSLGLALLLSLVIYVEALGLALLLSLVIYVEVLGLALLLRMMINVETVGLALHLRLAIYVVAVGLAEALSAVNILAVIGLACLLSGILENLLYEIGLICKGDIHNSEPYVKIGNWWRMEI